MDNFFVRSWWVLALRGAAGILFGVLTLAWPGLTLLTLIALFAAYALLGGAAAVVGAVRHRRSEDDWRLVMLLGLVSIGAGVVAVMRPALTALVLVMAANALVIGVLDIVAATRLRRAIEGEWMLVLAGLASIAFGAIVFLYPFAGVLTLIWMVSLYAFLTGALLLMQAARVRSRALACAWGCARRCGRADGHPGGHAGPGPARAGRAAHRTGALNLPACCRLMTRIQRSTANVCPKRRIVASPIMC